MKREYAHPIFDFCAPELADILTESAFGVGNFTEYDEIGFDQLC